MTQERSIRACKSLMRHGAYPRMHRSLFSIRRGLEGRSIRPLAGEAVGSVELLYGLVPGLKDLDRFERIWLLYWFDRAADCSFPAEGPLARPGAQPPTRCE